MFILSKRQKILLLCTTNILHFGKYTTNIPHFHTSFRLSILYTDSAAKAVREKNCRKLITTSKAGSWKSSQALHAKASWLILHVWFSVPGSEIQNTVISSSSDCPQCVQWSNSLAWKTQKQEGLKRRGLIQHPLRSKHVCMAAPVFESDLCSFKHFCWIHVNMVSSGFLKQNISTYPLQPKIVPYSIAVCPKV